MAPAALLICLALAAHALASSIWLMPDNYTVSQDGASGGPHRLSSHLLEGNSGGVRGGKGLEREAEVSVKKKPNGPTVGQWGKPPDWRNKR